MGYRPHHLVENLGARTTSHSHHGHHEVDASRLRTAFVLTVVILAIESIAGYAANSLALLSDAGHILTDAFALGLAWFALHFAQLPPNERNTFGYRRTGILAALANAVLLFVIALIIGVEAVLRVQHPQHVAGGVVIGGAALAILVNAYIARSLHQDHGHNLNVRAAFLHVLGDLAASAGVIVAGVLILIWKAYLADPLLSFGIAALVSLGAWRIVRDTLSILMEGTPPGMQLDTVAQAMREVPGVLDVHDLHIWALSDGFRLLSAHVTIPDQSLTDTASVLADLKLLLRRRFHIEHATIEPECVDCRVPYRRPIYLQVIDGDR